MFFRVSKMIYLCTLRYKTHSSTLLALETMMQQGPRPMVICGPSGSGKSTLLKRLFEEFPDHFGFSVSHTTRNPRDGEIDGVHYNFLSRPAMEKAIEDGLFLETAEYSKNLYGTSKEAVEKVSQRGKICVLDIEIQGVKQIKETNLNPLYVFVKPPSIQILEQRLRMRGTETEDSLKRRLAIAVTELEYGITPGNFDIVIENDELDHAYMQLRDVILIELERCKKLGIEEVA